jgi:hypothetical protein
MLAYVETVQSKEKEIGCDVLTHQKWCAASSLTPPNTFSDLRFAMQEWSGLHRWNFVHARIRIFEHLFTGKGFYRTLILKM